MSKELFLGVDGGQSHTEAVVADRAGRVLGRGRGGPSNHAEQPGGRERLRRAVTESVGRALSASGANTVSETEFAAAHLAMTGGAEYKEEVISGVLRARRLEVGHDAPAALAGATGGEPGVVVIAGTGSVAYGEDGVGGRLRAGGWGHMFGDEGSGFWLALKAARCAMLADDGLAAPTALSGMLLDFFGRRDLSSLSKAVYGEEITRDRFAGFAAQVQRAAEEGDAAAQAIVGEGGRFLAALVSSVARRLRFSPAELRIACVGGVFRGAPMRVAFGSALRELQPDATIVEARFDPAAGALLLAYRAAGVEKSHGLLMNLGRPPGADARGPATWE